MKEFLVRAKKATYASGGGRVDATRSGSKDLVYTEDTYRYHDSYLGADPFIGEEVVYQNDIPVWGMNYIGRTLVDGTGYDFLKEALMQVTVDMPYRGPAEYIRGEYIYRCHLQGDFDCFFGDEEILCGETVIYACRFHGGKIR